MSSQRAALFSEAIALGKATAWAQQLGAHFRHVALFAIDGTLAHPLIAFGLRPRELPTVSLVEQTPLRWTIEAASPLIGAGRAPGGDSVARALGLPTPRSYAVLPYMYNGHLLALAYADNGADPLPLHAVGQELTAFAEPTAASVLHLEPPPPAPAPEPSPPAPAVHDVRPVVVQVQHAPPRPAPHGKAIPAGLPSPLSTPSRAPHLRMVQLEEPLHEAPRPSPVAVAWWRLRRFVRTQLRRVYKTRLLVALLALGVLAAVGELLAASAPPARGEPVELEVLDADNVATIGRALEDTQVIRSSTLLRVMARLSGLDRTLRAGTYVIAPNLWLWDVLQILHRGQVQTVRVTLPEGLTLAETASVWAQHGLVKRDDFLAAASDRTLLSKYRITAPTAEGFLFPETYTVARGVPAKLLVETQLRAFFEHAARLPQTTGLSPDELYDRVIVASLVEREARDPTEQPRIAGVFYNRLNQDMRLESCATVQYLLDKPKERLTLEDVRMPSPYNTYLHPGLPPGPIANPGRAAFAAALKPEDNNYLYFFALEDGSHHHHFSRTYAEHAKAHRHQRHGVQKL